MPPNTAAELRLVRVSGGLPTEFAALQAAAHREGFGMLDRLAADWAAGTGRFDGPGEMLLAAFCGGALVAVGGRTVDPALPGAMRMRRFYVGAGHRGRQVGRALAEALLRDVPRPVTVNAAVGSAAFWEALGFTPDRRDGRTHILRG